MYYIVLYYYYSSHAGLSKPNEPPPTDLDANMSNDDDYANYDDEDENKSGQDRSNKEINTLIAPPYFEPTEYMTSVKTGDSAILECNVKNYGRESLKQNENTYTNYINSQFQFFSFI